MYDPFRKEQPKQKKPSRLPALLALACVGSFSVGAMVGDAVDISRHLLEPLRYMRTPASLATPQDYWNYDRKIVVNEEGRLELHFGNEETGEYFKVTKDGHVGGFFEEVTNYAKEMRTSLESKFEEFREYITNGLSTLSRNQEVLEKRQQELEEKRRGRR